MPLSNAESTMNKSVFLLAALLPGIAAAEGLAVTGKVGTLGFGGELTAQASENFNLRFGLNGYNWNYNTTESDVEYDAKLRLQTAGFIGDYFPIEGSIFRVSLGLMYNNNHLDMTAKPSGGTYNLNGVDYPAATVGTLTGKLTYTKTAPYIGVGWGNPFVKERGWAFSLDVGAIYQGNPRFRLTTNSSLCDATCQSNLAAEQAQDESDLRHYRWYPAVSAGAAYRF
jgi:hypothetical protein